jgi:hypothetical protein
MMRGTCDFCDQPAVSRCHSTNCTKQMCDAHAQRQQDTGTQPLGKANDPYLVFFTYCPEHADVSSNKLQTW